MYLSETPWLPPSLNGLSDDALERAVEFRSDMREIMDHVEGPTDIQLGHALSTVITPV